MSDDKQEPGRGEDGGRTIVTDLEVTQRRGPSNPFRKGYDPRRNLSGRPLDVRGLRAKIRENGEAMVEVLLGIAGEIPILMPDVDAEGNVTSPFARVVGPSHMERARAAIALLEFGYGRPKDAGADEPDAPVPFDMSKLSPEEMAQLKNLVAKARSAT